MARHDDTMHVVCVLQPVGQFAQKRAIEAGRVIFGDLLKEN